MYYKSPECAYLREECINDYCPPPKPCRPPRPPKPPAPPECRCDCRCDAALAALILLCLCR